MHANMPHMLNLAARFLNRTLLIAIIPCAFFISLPFPTQAVTQDIDVKICIERILDVQYTGETEITFNLAQRDINEGSMGMMDQGDLNWCTNTAPWIISVERTEWRTLDGSPAPDLWLQVKYDLPNDSGWLTVNIFPTPWIYGASMGRGTFQGVDWKIKDLSRRLPPASYSCTVTIMIEPA